MRNLFSLKHLVVLFLSSVMATAWPALAQEDANEPAMLVLDASGSMWGKIGEDTKIEIARTIIDDLVTTWDTDTPLGLMAYGHRKKGDCSDIEILLPAAKIDAEGFSKKVKALNPTGKTPMVQSVINAAEAMSYTDQKSTVILVSDGEETCGLDPCEIGRSLAEKGVDFTAHVIGFDVSLTESAGMRCLAEETGGRYMDAENAEQLKDAMVVVANDTTTEVVQEEVTGPATVDVLKDQVIGGTRFEVEWTGPKNRRDRLVITSADGKTRFNGRYIDVDSAKSPTSLRAPETAGNYQVHYMTRDKRSLAFDDFIILPPEASLNAPDTDVVGGSRVGIEVSAPNMGDDKIGVFNAAGEKLRSFTVRLGFKDGVKTITAQPGVYTLKYLTKGGKVLATDEITVIAAKAYIIAPDTDIPGGGDFMVKVSEANSHKDKISIYTENGKRIQSWTVKSWRKNGEMKISAPEEPGTYSVKYMSGDKKVLASDKLNVIAPTAQIDAPDGPILADSRFDLTVSTPNSNKEKINIVNSDGKRVKSWTVSRWVKNGKMTITAPDEPGTYELIYVTGKKRELARDSITVVGK